eukprot:PRCOL_00004135-RA
MAAAEDSGESEEEEEEDDDDEDEEYREGRARGAAGDDSGSEDEEDYDESDSDGEGTGAHAAAEADVPLGERLASKRDGRTSARKVPAWLAAKREREAREKIGARANKNRPQEVSSKARVPMLREIEGLAPAKPKSKDPRFDASMGAFNDRVFRKQYGFVFDEKMAEERDALKQQVKRTHGAARKEQLKRLVASLEAKVADHQKRRRDAALEDESRRRQRERARGGRGPYFEKKSDRKKRELVDKYESLKKSGQLEKFMAKRRRKVAAKDRTLMPTASRRGVE